jgi:P-type Cu+ transporter
MTETEIELVCYHCGLECENEDIQFEDKIFCCNGCKSVFQILDKNSLCQYYDFDKNAGIKPKNDQFNYLNEPEIANNLLDFKNEQLAKVTFFVPSIHCSSCLYLLENLTKIDDGITRSKVNFLQKKVEITFNHKQISLAEIANLLSSIGYEPLISAQPDQSKPTKIADRELITKLAVAGFCASNIMLFSFPEYLGLENGSFKQLFNYLSILLSIPVVIYSGSGYFKSVFSSLKKGFLNIDFPILLSILVAFFAGIYQVVFKNEAGYFDSLTGLIFFLLIGKWFQQKSYSFLSFERDYKSYFPLSVSKLTFGKVTPIALSNLQKGDKIVVRNGEIIPSDSMLYKGIANIDYSFVTGEAALESKQIGDFLYAGGRQVGGSIEMEVLKNVSQSYLTQLWNNDTFQKNHTSTIQSFSNLVGKYFTIGVLILAFSVAGFWYFNDPSKMLNAFVSVLIIACPCTLALSYPFALGNGLRLFGKKSFYLKNADIIEQMANCDTIVFDKTGTITSGATGSVRFEGNRKLSVFEENLVSALVRNSTHPVALEIQKLFPENIYFTIQNFQESVGSGIEGEYDGFKIKLGKFSFVNDSKSAVFTKQDKLNSRAFLVINNEYLGYFNMPNKYRAGIEETIVKLTEKYHTYLLSGDNSTEQANLEKSFFVKRNLLFNQSPQMKLNFIKSLQKEGKKVIMIGDGLNDAGALKQADVGIAVAENTLNFTPMSDAILLANQLKNLPNYLKYSQYAMKLIKYSYGFSLMYNCIGLSFAIQGSLSPIVAAVLMPLNSITLVGIASLGMIFGAKRILD